MRRWLAGLTVVGLTTPLCVLGAASPVHAQDVGYVRLAHLSPDTPEVDVYLNSQSSGFKEQVFPGVGYGVMSKYLALPVGGYTVAMRLSGAAPTTPAVLTTQVSVSAGGAYTVAGVGRYAGLGLKVLKDDLTLPAENKTKVRIVQASVKAPILGVSVANGPSIAENVAFATTTDYQLVDPGNWRLMIRPAGGSGAKEVSTNLGAGSVYSLLILDSKPSGLKTELRVDALRQGGVPDGGVQTGGGGLENLKLAAMGLIGSVVLLLLAVGVILRVRRARSKVL
ncbi:MAG TPA: DUF4397 domain-containing protein [Candidatus Limnocylindrales bacterium]|nr:DUF4397 domain-containing protein [Candidatus Limnocylindrales bacterium]